jgi:hypothetical protein
MNDIAGCTWMGIMPAPARNLFSGQSKERGRDSSESHSAMDLLTLFSTSARIAISCCSGVGVRKVKCRRPE